MLHFSPCKDGCHPYMYAQIDDSKYVFGEKGQRVGMNKEIVEKIIPNSKKATSNEDKGIHSLLW